jgi:hypothetical protein
MKKDFVCQEDLGYRIWGAVPDNLFTFVSPIIDLKIDDNLLGSCLEMGLMHFLLLFI